MGGMDAVDRLLGAPGKALEAAVDDLAAAILGAASGYDVELSFLPSRARNIAPIASDTSSADTSGCSVSSVITAR